MIGEYKVYYSVETQCIASVQHSLANNHSKKKGNIKPVTSALIAYSHYFCATSMSNSLSLLLMP